MRQESYRVYKGLQKPIVLLGLKGPCITWALGSFGAAIVIFIAGFLITGAMTGIMMACIPLSFGIYKVMYKMKNGLHEKKRHKDILVVQNLIKRV